MARIVLADPLIDVIAPGESLASGGGKINAALASINTMTSELYNSVQLSTYAGNIPVAFDGSSDCLTTVNMPFDDGTPEAATFVFIINPTDFAAQRQLFFANSLMKIAITTGGLVAASFACVTGGTVQSNVGTVPLVAGQRNVVQLTVKCVASGSTCTTWVNGKLSSFIGGAQTGGINFDAYSAYALFGTTASSALFLGSAELVWIISGPAERAYITRQMYDFSFIRDLGPAFAYGPDVAPEVCFGGQQSASAWNAGTNQGNPLLAAWTMAGDGVT